MSKYIVVNTPQKKIVGKKSKKYYYKQENGVYKRVKKKELYYYREEGTEEKYTIEKLKELYENSIDKEEYPDFEIWLYDMGKMQILIKMED